MVLPLVVSSSTWIIRVLLYFSFSSFCSKPLPTISMAATLPHAIVSYSNAYCLLYVSLSHSHSLSCQKSSHSFVNQLHQSLFDNN